jgi:hypothetical protein
VGKTSLPPLLRRLVFFSSDYNGLFFSKYLTLRDDFLHLFLYYYLCFALCLLPISSKTGSFCFNFTDLKCVRLSWPLGLGIALLICNTLSCHCPFPATAPFLPLSLSCYCPFLANTLLLLQLLYFCSLTRYLTLPNVT